MGVALKCERHFSRPFLAAVQQASEPLAFSSRKTLETRVHGGEDQMDWPS